MNSQKSLAPTPARELKTTSQNDATKGWFSILVGLAVSAVFYMIVSVISWAPTDRYFFGHPVAIAATILFWVAIAVLGVKWARLLGQWNRLDSIRDQDLAPMVVFDSPAEEWSAEHDARYIAKSWMQNLQSLPGHTRSSKIVSRLEELLVRQSQRGTTKHLADDLRELSSRDADTAHDSFGLVRIIVWAIPMLGFLGTVIGITQTLGGLDFTDGTAAVDRLKSGLYVAFDTTALGLVLSVLAIFIQFPVEKSEQQLLAEIDSRVGHLLSKNLPSDEVVDNQTALVTDLCEGIRAAVAESLDSQAKLWRATIEEAHNEWHTMHQTSVNKLAQAFELTLVPALNDHANQLANHANGVGEASRKAAQQLHDDWKRWSEQISENGSTLATHHELMVQQCQAFSDSQAHTQAIQSQSTEIQQQAVAIQSLQRALDTNLSRLSATTHETQAAVEKAVDRGIPDAMLVLARAVDALNNRLPAKGSQTRRAA